ncbi:ornithine-acyl[acyl carrier protein] N-acyltransferase [Jannaschia faecimaris]|uniref:L-ornithine N(alpha)-acyltransferase n=1 Tax=Jannaschia faecimaris TaxID=1244108 RepID=A0A1H3QLZ0_9RHOB|nr:GNAT family N-acetyltransferase [Jannaschia faecimaris]SDZ13995.1 ornithine-acyl[acyl carrier protein] N-acyltransferase [Jannaschia faecimaris]
MNLTAGRWRARLLPLAMAGAAFDLRARTFRGGRDDVDRFDAHARHLLIEDGTLPVACARLTVQDAAGMAAGYTAQHYDLTAFAACFPRALEVGRICLAPGSRDAEAGRLLLAMLARVVMAEDVAVLYGCSSFPSCGTGMARLARHKAPETWGPGPKAANRTPLPMISGPLPPLLRSYLSLGAAVSDHAVVDDDLNTLHVFTALPIAAIPPARARLLTGLLDAA